MINFAYLRAMQYLSPTFPIGAYAYSQGLEQAISSGLVTDSASLHSWISAILCHGSARNDAIFLAHARHADAQNLAELAYAMAGSLERDLELREMGRAYAAQMSALDGQDFPVFPLPVAIGFSMRDLAVSTVDILALFLLGYAAQLISVGVRFIPLGQSAGQVILAALGSQILQTAHFASTASLNEIGSSTIGADMASMAHETLDIRIYRT